MILYIPLKFKIQNSNLLKILKKKTLLLENLFNFCMIPCMRFSFLLNQAYIYKSRSVEELLCWQRLLLTSTFQWAVVPSIIYLAIMINFHAKF